jgi:hypothetical protein
LLVAESLVPEMFAVMAPCYADLADTTYFTEHVAVDSDEHAAWMADAVDDVLAIYGASCVPTILAGMADAFAEALDDPDELWRSRCASR